MEQRRDLVERIPASVMEVARRLQEAGHAAYVVGGAVRDLLLGRIPADWDIATSARPEEVRRLFADHRLVEVGLRHGSVTIIVSEGTPSPAAATFRDPRAVRAVEVTTFRVEGPYSDRRRPDYVQFVDNLRHDLGRRDFTVNAVALDPFTAQVHDPWQGRADIETGLVRAVGNAEERFREDALRIVRAVRLVAEFGWRLESATARAMLACRHLAKEVAAERVRAELERILLAPYVDVALRLATELGLWPFTALAPLPRAPGATSEPGIPLRRPTLTLEPGLPPRRPGPTSEPGIPPRRPGPTLELGRLPPRLDLRLAALLATCPDPEQVLAGLRFPGEVTRRVAHIVSNLLLDPPLHWSPADIRRWVARVGGAVAGDIIMLGALLAEQAAGPAAERTAERAAERTAEGAAERATERAAEWEEFSRRVSALLAQGFPTTASDLAISGADIMRILECPPGPRVGEVLTRLLELVWENPELNTAETLRWLAARMR